MTNETVDVDAKIKNACERFMKNDRRLLELDTSERSMTHKLAEYLQQEFPGWDVDCEYNRDGHNPKVLVWNECPHSPRVSGRVFPDVVIHRRDTRENLVAIEAKKSIKKSNGHDDCKLKVYRQSLHYQHCFLVAFPIGKDGCNDLMLRKFSE